MVLLREWS